MKKLVSSEEGHDATVQPENPCSDCPLRRDSLSGWLGGTGTPDDWVACLHSDARMDCHVLRGAQCAGAAIYRANVYKSPRDKTVLRLAPNREQVFSSPGEFVTHHSEPLKETSDA